MWGGILSGAVQGLMQEDQKDDGSGLVDTGTGFLMYRPGKAKDYVGAIVGGALSGVAGGMMQKGADKRELMMDDQKAAAAEDREIKKKSGQLDTNFKALMEGGHIPEGTDKNSLSPRQKAEMWDGVNYQLELGGKVLDRQYKQKQIDLMGREQEPFNPEFRDLDGDGQPDVLMTSRNSAQSLRTEGKSAPTDVGPQGARVRYPDGSVGVWDGSRYKVQQPRYVSNETFTKDGFSKGQVLEDVSGLPLYGAETPAPAAPSNDAAIAQIQADYKAGKMTREAAAAALRKLGLQ
jgi:hypothetical protein